MIGDDSRAFYTSLVGVACQGQLRFFTSFARFLMKMRGSLSFLSLALSCVSWITHTNAIETRQNVGLSTCVQRCHDIILPAYSCDSSTDLCFCVVTGLQDMLDVCVASNCTIAQHLESQSFNARTCGIPQRDHAAMIKILSWTLFCSATVFFLMRVVACAFSNNGFRGDDWFVFSCYAALAGSTVCIHLATANGLGAENYLFDVGQLEKVKMLFYTFELLGNFILFGTKVALVLLYLRILPSSAVSYAYRSLCWSFVGLLILTFIATELAMILQCLPITSIWNFYPGEAGQCLDMATLQRAASALDLIYSMVLLFLPIPPLLATERSPVQQIGLICIYIAGIAIIICSLGRTVVSSPPTLTTTTIKAAQPTDLTQPVIWTLLQLNLSLILISLPPLSSLSNHSLIRIRIKPNSILPHSGSAEEILAEEDRRRSGLQSTTLEIKAFGHDGGDGGTNGNGEDVRRNNYNINGIDERINDSPGLHVGVGDATVTFQHNIPKAATRDKIVYRDAEGLMHEVELIDRPGLIVEQ